MTEIELNKLQDLVDSCSVTNWELVRLILESEGYTDGKLLSNMFYDHLINYNWNICEDNYTHLADGSLWIMVNIGEKMRKFLNKYSYDYKDIALKDTKAYERFIKNNKFN